MKRGKKNVLTGGSAAGSTNFSKYVDSRFKQQKQGGGYRGQHNAPSILSGEIS